MGRVLGEALTKGIATPRPAVELMGIDVESARVEMVERLKFQVGYSEAVIKALVLVNGGAMVALFTFVGNASQANLFRFDIGQLWVAFALFATGISAALVAAVGGFFSQGFFYNVSQLDIWMAQEARLTGQTPKDNRNPLMKWGRIFQYAGVASATSSMILFSIGAGIALFAVL
jgi:hypothetical protein